MTKTRKKSGPNQSIDSLRISKGPNKEPESPISLYHYVQGLGKSLQVNIGAPQSLRGRVGNLIKQMYCVCGYGSMRLPPDAMHFHSGAGLLHCAKWAWSRGQAIHFISSRNQRTVREKEGTRGQNILEAGLADIQEILQALRTFCVTCSAFAAKQAHGKESYLQTDTQLTFSQQRSS